MGDVTKLHFGKHASEHVSSVACLAGVAAETAERSMLEYIKKAVRVSDNFDNDSAIVKHAENKDVMELAHADSARGVPLCLQQLDTNMSDFGWTAGVSPNQGMSTTAVDEHESMQVDTGHCQRARQHKLTAVYTGSSQVRVGSEKARGTVMHIGDRSDAHWKDLVSVQPLAAVLATGAGETCSVVGEFICRVRELGCSDSRCKFCAGEHDHIFDRNRIVVVQSLTLDRAAVRYCGRHAPMVRTNPSFHKGDVRRYGVVATFVQRDLFFPFSGFDDQTVDERVIVGVLNVGNTKVRKGVVGRVIRYGTQQAHATLLSACLELPHLPCPVQTV